MTSKLRRYERQGLGPGLYSMAFEIQGFAPRSMGGLGFFFEVISSMTAFFSLLVSGGVDWGRAMDAEAQLTGTCSKSIIICFESQASRRCIWFSAFAFVISAIIRSSNHRAFEYNARYCDRVGALTSRVHRSRNRKVNSAAQRFILDFSGHNPASKAIPCHMDVPTPRTHVPSHHLRPPHNTDAVLLPFKRQRPLVVH